MASTSSNNIPTEYCKLKNISHLRPFLNIIGVIDTIIPKIGHPNKRVQRIDLEISDETKFKPGFEVRLRFDQPTQNRFMDICTTGLVLEVLEMKIVKSEGVVYGEVTDADDVNLYTDKAVYLPWNSSDRRICRSSIPGHLKSIIEDLLAWKIQYFETLQNEELHYSCIEEKTPTRRLKNISEKRKLNKNSFRFSPDSNNVTEEVEQKMFRKKKSGPKRRRSISKKNYCLSSSGSESDNSKESMKRKKRPDFFLNSDDSSCSSGGKTSLSTNKNLGSTPKKDQTIEQKSVIKKRGTPKNALEMLMTFLNPLARKMDVAGAQNFGDVSFCEIKEIEYCIKCDLVCKVICQKQLFDDGIQIVRVQDGGIRPGRTLLFPEGSSWSEITNKIKDDPLTSLITNSPVLDIVILDFTRLDSHIQSDQFYHIHNVMGVALHIKGHKLRQEDLFFCVEGQNAYIKKIKPAPSDEIYVQLNKMDYKNALKMFEAQALTDSCTKDDQNDNSPKSIKTKSITKINSDNVKSVNKTTTATSSKQLEEKTQLQKKRTNPVQEAGDSSHSKKMKHDQDISNETNDLVKSVKNKQNIVDSQDPFKQTDFNPNLFRELVEVIHENVDLPRTASEDVHLKNSGSELNYLDFLKNAKVKSKNFRTSTQETALSCDQTGDCNSEMESLRYASSSSTEHTGAAKTLKEPYGAKNMSLQARPSAAKKSLQFEIVKTKVNETVHADPKIVVDNLKCTNSSSSGSVTLDELNKKHDDMKSTTKTDLNYAQSDRNDVKPKHLIDFNQESNISKKVNNNTHKIDGNSEKSDDSSDASLISYDYIHPKRIIPNRQAETGAKWYEDEKNLLAIPDHCFYQSKASTTSDKELSKGLGKRDMALLKNHYKQPRPNEPSNFKDYPIVPLEVVWKIANKNIITTNVWLTSITPSSDSWKDAIKSKCSSCGNVFNVGSDTRFTNVTIAGKQSDKDDTLTVQSQLCPESQCCSKILDSPEFNFSLEFKINSDPSCNTTNALAAGRAAEMLFGCTAEQALKNRKKQKKVLEVLKKIELCIKNNDRSRVTFTRKNITCPKSGPLLIQNIH